MLPVPYPLFFFFFFLMESGIFAACSGPLPILRITDMPWRPLLSHLSWKVFCTEDGKSASSLCIWAGFPSTEVPRQTVKLLSWHPVQSADRAAAMEAQNIDRYCGHRPRPVKQPLLLF